MRYRVDKPFSGSFHNKFPVGSFVETEKVEGNFVWFNGSCIATAKEFFECCTVVDKQLSALEYEMEVSKQQKHYPALKGEEIRPDWILEAYKAGISPVQFLNGLLDAA